VTGYRLRFLRICAVAALCAGAALPAEAAHEGAAGGAALGPTSNPAIADMLHRLNPQLIAALAEAFATLPDTDPKIGAARARAGEIGAAIGLSGAEVEGMLRILGSATVPVEPVAEKLIQMAEACDLARSRLAPIPLGDGAVDEARTALDGGRFAAASEALAKAATPTAPIVAAQGDIATVRLDDAGAAADYRRAAALTADTRADDKAALLARAGAAAMRQGDAGDEGGFVTAASAFGDALQALPRERSPLVWGAVESNLGDALLALGEAQDDAVKLGEAIAAYRAALQELTRERAPGDWAATENNLAEALWKLGDQQSDPANLEAAVAAVRAALSVRTPEEMPSNWAASQNILGNALRSLGEREAGPDRLVAAVAAYRDALLGEPRDRMPLDWATTESNLGNALAELAERETGTQHLTEAIAAYRAALDEQTRERAPLDWARTQNNLGNALAALGQREPGTARLNDAVTAFQAALGERTRDREPLSWAMTQNNLAGALEALGEREHSRQRLADAVAAYDAALAVFTAAGASQYAEVCTANRARAAASLAKAGK
jgi:tetratricopeptide (TPR) repeat protein